MTDAFALITVRDLTIAYGDFVVLKDVNFSIGRGEVFIIMGGSGCGKSTLMKALVGLKAPVRGAVYYGDTNFWDAQDEDQAALLRRFGVLYQSGALWSSMTLGENVGLPLELYTELGAKQIREVVSFKLSLVGLSGYENRYPSELSGGMRKRAGIARAMALDPEILFFDEPSAGLDPLTARRLDELILEIRENLQTTIVLVTHELASIFTVGTDAVFLDAGKRTVTARGDPKMLRDHSGQDNVRRFLRRGEA
jgi:phospholipid/cholesterol/gamma-HCH transport system ATP-binding protein